MSNQAEIITTRGNDFFLRVNLYKILDNEQVEPFDLTACDNYTGSIKNEYSETPLAESIGLVEGTINAIAIDCAGLELGMCYVVEITGSLDGRHFRCAEKCVLGVTEYNTNASVSEQTIEAGIGVDLNMTFELLESSAIVGKNAYELAVEQGYEGTLQDYLDEMVDAGQSAQAADDAAQAANQASQTALNSAASAQAASNAANQAAQTANNAATSLSTLIESKYEKPSGGIPKSDLASSVQTSLGKADTALQSFTETDPTVPSWAKTPNKPTYTADEVGAIQNREIFDGDIRQSGNTYINLLDDVLYASDKRFVTSIEVKDASGNTISTTSPIPNSCFNLFYDGGRFDIESGTTAILIIKGGEDITAIASRMLTYGQGYLYVHFYSAINNLPKSITGRIYKQYSPASWQTLTFTLMENPSCCYRARIEATCVYPSAIEITIEGDDSRTSQIVEIEWWTQRKDALDLPLMSKYKNETLYYPLTLKDKLTVNNKVEANQFAVASSNNNYLLLGGGSTKPISDFALASSLSSYYTKTEIDNKKFVSSSTSGLKIEVVNELPQTPDNDTIYIIR